MDIKENEMRVRVLGIVPRLIMYRSDISGDALAQVVGEGARQRLALC